MDKPDDAPLRLPMRAPLSLESFTSLRRSLIERERDCLRELEQTRAARAQVTEQAKRLGLVPRGRRPLEGLSVPPDDAV